MHIESLEFFQKIARLKSISKVAHSSHISQSALSQQMQRIEESLGFQLFIRSNRGVELTERGNIVLKYSENIIRTYNKMMEELAKQGKIDDTIKIEADRTIATYCLPCALYKMKENYPAHKYDLVSGSSEEIEQDVLNDICDVGFITSKPSENSLSSFEVVNERVVLIAWSNYNISEQIQLKDFLSFPHVMLKGDCIIREGLDTILKYSGYSINDLNIIFELDSIEAVKTMVSSGYGIGFVPYTSVKRELHNKEVKIVKLKDMVFSYRIFLINKPEIKLNTCTVEFIEGFKRLGVNICC